MIVKLDKLVVQSVPYSEKGLKNLESISYGDRQVILNYAGAILGLSIKYRDGKIVIDVGESHDKNATKTQVSDGLSAEEHLQNALNVLMKSGVHGLYLYAVDDELRNKLLHIY